MGPELHEFEAAFASFCGVEHCAGVSTGTDAVRLALQAAGVKPGDEVIVPVNTFIATAEAVSHCGATPVFVDCLPDTANIDPSRIGEAVTPRTVAILPVHLYGQPADMESIGRIAGERGLAVVEDACQAHGARFQGKPCGSMGLTAAFSFYPGKNLGALGDGGAVTTDSEVADRMVRLLRNHGELDQVGPRGGGLLQPSPQPPGGIPRQEAAAPCGLERGAPRRGGQVRRRDRGPRRTQARSST